MQLPYLRPCFTSSSVLSESRRLVLSTSTGGPKQGFAVSLRRWLGGQAGTNWDGWLLTVASQVASAAASMQYSGGRSPSRKTKRHTALSLTSIVSSMSLCRCCHQKYLRTEIACHKLMIGWILSCRSLPVAVVAEQPFRSATHKFIRSRAF